MRERVISPISLVSRYLANSYEGISNFRISGQSFMKENCHNFGTSDYIDMKLGPVTKIDKRNKAAPKKLGNNVMLASCDVIGAIWKLDSGCIVCKTYIFINSNLLSYRNWKQN